MNNFMWNHLV